MDKVIKIERSHQIIVSLNGDSKNPAILLIHGWISHRGVWQQTIRALESKYYCVSMDLLGFGASDKPAEADYSLPTQAQRITRLAEMLELPRYSLIGHSMGGQMAMYIATILAPRNVDKLVSVGGVVTGRLAPNVEKTNLPMVRLARRWPGLYGLARSLASFRPAANWIFRPWFYDMNALPFEAWEADRLAATNPASAIPTDEAGKSMRETKMEKYLHKVKAETLLIAGQEDGTVPVEQAYLAQTIIPNNQLAIIKKCGHYPMYEKTGQYLKALSLIF